MANFPCSCHLLRPVCKIGHNSGCVNQNFANLALLEMSLNKLSKKTNFIKIRCLLIPQIFLQSQTTFSTTDSLSKFQISSLKSMLKIWLYFTKASPCMWAQIRVKEKRVGFGWQKRPIEGSFRWIWTIWPIRHNLRLIFGSNRVAFEVIKAGLWHHYLCHTQLWLIE